MSVFRELYDRKASSLLLDLSLVARFSARVYLDRVSSSGFPIPLYPPDYHVLNAPDAPEDTLCINGDTSSPTLIGIPLHYLINYATKLYSDDRMQAHAASNAIDVSIAAANILGMLTAREVLLDLSARYRLPEETDYSLIVRLAIREIQKIDES